MDKSFKCEVKDGKDIAENAKSALERVCSGKGLDSLSKYYSPEFVDHVNDVKFEGLEGARQSVELYTKILSDIEIVVEEQIRDEDRVTSRFVVTGNSFGRRVRFNGITISRFKDGLIVEDWSVTDTFGMLRQLGVWRSLMAGVRQLKAMKRR
jgi:ketosteroid isomerase-like protein